MEDGCASLPTFADIAAARDLLAAHLPVTPMWSYPALNAAVGATVFLKHENVQPTGAFKVRGGLNLLAGMSPAQRAIGTITYSTGNHAQSMAYASAQFDAPCTVVMPSNAASSKVRALTALGAVVELHGLDMASAQARAEELAVETGQLLVSPGDTPELIAGVGTAYVEIFEARSAFDVVIVPIGSGTGASGACLAAARLAPHCRVIGVQSTAARAAHDSWRAGECVRRPIRTRADGLATGRGYRLPQAVMCSGLADFQLVTDDDIRSAQALLASDAHTLAEGAGAASLAAILARPARFAGRRVAVVVTGGNASPAEIAALAGAARTAVSDAA
ncbi:threonine/serine dehydratase [Pseudofrankia sp. DC12]|uniref:threonine ammonia-lyase n=1 Tax=Pseudofrankia sp. DC12 TaxID=683315 RepID=UPI0005F800CB|nr:threonine/serine dehydratase [Pseudofrankia sp. DC12]